MPGEEINLPNQPEKSLTLIQFKQYYKYISVFVSILVMLIIYPHILTPAVVAQRFNTQLLPTLFSYLSPKFVISLSEDQTLP